VDAGFVVRTATVNDAFTLQAVVAAVARERQYLGSTEGFTLEQTRDYIARLHAAGGVQLVALATPEHDDRRRRTGQALLGWVDILPGPFEGLTHCGRLGMGVAPDARGQGVGTALLAHALEAGFRTLERIELEVFASNSRARALYLRAGFVEEGRRRCARKLDGSCDDILMFGLLREEWRGAPRDSRVTPHG
jgi:RimJ/RimL family protein N-acetyltransferase